MQRIRRRWKIWQEVRKINKIENKKIEDKKKAEELIERLTMTARQTLIYAGAYTVEESIGVSGNKESTTIFLRFPTKEKDFVKSILKLYGIKFQEYIQRGVEGDLTIEAITLTDNGIETNDAFVDEVRDLLKPQELSIEIFSGMISEEQLERMRIPKVEQRPRN